MGRRVLVVDDDPWILRMVSASLEKLDYVVDTASDGPQALSHVCTRRPDVILCELMMPGMDGPDLARRIRALPGGEDIPMIFLTALDQAQAVRRGLASPAEQILSKPFRFADLQQRIANALNRDPSGALAEPAGAPSPAVQSPRPAPTLAELAYQGPASPYLPPPKADPPDGPAAPARGVAMSGALEQLTLSSLLLVIEMERKDGILALGHSDSGATGHIFVREGRVVSAQLAPNGLDGPAAMYAMLDWKCGSFRFTATKVDLPDTVQTSTTHLVLAAARRADENAYPEDG